MSECNCCKDDLGLKRETIIIVIGAFDSCKGLQQASQVQTLHIIVPLICCSDVGCYSDLSRREGFST